MYLTNRSQLVQINSTRSSLLPVLSGVPQGSILGPLLFLVYVNDMESVIIFSRILLFADDTKCFRSISNPTEVDFLQQDIDSFYKWSLDNHLDFNLKKSVALSFHGNLPPPNRSYSLSDNQLPNKTRFKDLGVTMSADMVWSNHLDQIISSALNTLALLRRSFSHTSSTAAIKRLYLVMVRPKLLYCSQIWQPRLVKDFLQLEKVQRLATKYILNDYTLSYSSRLKKLELLPLTMMLELNDILFLIRSLKSPSPAFDILNYIQFYNSSSRLSTFRKLKPNLNNWLYFNRVVHLWNALPFIVLCCYN